MPNEVRIDARRDFVRRGLPWLVAAAMFVLYFLTLNQWMSLFNLDNVVRISGWTWRPQYDSPLFYLVTLPLRMLSAGKLPLALNLFSAVCAALTMGLLTRSVGLLPHDRTEAQQVRERNEFFVLTIRSAWFPPLLAALLCGLQLTFWEMATNGCVQVFDLLLFAYMVWSLVEYRLDGRVWRLYTSAAVVGAGMMEGPVMNGFFPLFVAAIIWVRGFDFFNVRFLIRIVLYGLAGFLLIFLFQLVCALSSQTVVPFWEIVKDSIATPTEVVELYWRGVINPMQYFDNLLIPLFITLIPLLIMSIRWKFGDSSKFGSMLSNLMFHAIHAIFLGVCIWVVFDPPFSPREKGLGLTLYYLIALSAGYYASYFLLVFGKPHPRVKEIPPLFARLANKAVVAGTWLLGILAIVGLYYKNAPLVGAENAGTLRQFTSLMAKNLPPKGAILLSDDANLVYFMQSALAGNEHARDYLFLDVNSLSFPEYHRFLHKESPQKWPLYITPQQTNKVPIINIMEMLASVAQTNELYYLHPSYGFYFEEFYLEPHGLIYKLRPLPNGTLLPPPPDKNLIAENETFWAIAQTGALASVESALTTPDPNAAETFGQRALARLHVPDEPSFNASLAGSYCSRSLNFWGVELQQAGDLTDAAINFERALRLNPSNAVAQINLQVNQDLSAGKPLHVDFLKNTAQVGQYDDMMQAIRECGPFDEPTYCFQFGRALTLNENRLYRQAVAPLNRACELDPHFLLARLTLAEIYGRYYLPARMIALLQAPLSRPQDFSADDFDSYRMHMLLSQAYFQQDKPAEGSRLLEMEISNDPTNQVLLNIVEQVYESRKMFPKAMTVTERELQLTPNDPDLLVKKGFLYNQLKQYSDAVTTLNAALAIQKDNDNAIFQIANAYVGSGNLDGARTNYERLQRNFTNSLQLAFALQDIAWRQHNTNEAIRNIQIYLTHAPTNSPQAQVLRTRLQNAKQPAGSK